MPKILYNKNDLEDVIHVLAFINSYTKNMGIVDVKIDTRIIERVVQSCKRDFPHSGGVDKASAFKQVANFVCYFVAEQPLQEPFPTKIIGDQLANVSNHQNAMLAFALAEEALNNSTIEKAGGNVTVDNPITYSKHSYIDIIDALSNITPSQHFKLLTVFFEQLVYKSNNGCQYQIC
uniref:Uncharacterized protein n=1 Tax=Candidatus Nitrotoga fabula TaxID=2182327 RepID=A0A2X0SJB0_9PROT|nr:protein of unknown function [Candidatus Nitrotoga fabula]